MALGIICDSPPIGLIGDLYSHAFPASSGTPPYTFAITLGILPTGLVLDVNTGIVSGTPTLKGVYPFSIQVTDSAAASVTINCSITIKSKCLVNE